MNGRTVDNGVTELDLQRQSAADVLKRISEKDMSGVNLVDRYAFAGKEIANAYYDLKRDDYVAAAFASGLKGTPFENILTQDQFGGALNEQSWGINYLNHYVTQSKLIKRWMEDLKVEMNTLPEHCRRDEFKAELDDMERQLAEIDKMYSEMGTVDPIDTMSELVARKGDMLRCKGMLDDVNRRRADLFHCIVAEKATLLAKEAASQTFKGKLSSCVSSFFGGSSTRRNAASASSLSASSANSESSATGYDYKAPTC